MKSFKVTHAGLGKVQSYPRCYLEGENFGGNLPPPTAHARLLFSKWKLAHRLDYFGRVSFLSFPPHPCRQSPKPSAIAFCRNQAQNSSIARPSGAKLKHRAAVRHKIEASRCHQAKNWSIAPPSGEKFKHRAAIRQKIEASHHHQVQNWSIAPPSGAKLKHRTTIRRKIQASR